MLDFELDLGLFNILGLCCELGSTLLCCVGYMRFFLEYFVIFDLYFLLLFFILVGRILKLLFFCFFEFEFLIFLIFLSG